jgi:septum formation protein
MDFIKILYPEGNTWHNKEEKAGLFCRNTREGDTSMEQIILASGSPRRQEYLKLLGLPFTSMPSDADENFHPGSEPGAVVRELAIRKVSKLVNSLKNGEAPLWVCGADTLISHEGTVYGKPSDRDDAGRMLRALQGKTHGVITAVALFNCRKKSIDCRSAASTVTFAPMTSGEIEWYLDSGEWQDAAGAYKIQGLASCVITQITGSYSAIVGLPLREFYAMLRDNGYPFGG